MSEPYAPTSPAASPAASTSASTSAGKVPIDFEAILSAMQDQIDDLTSVVEAHQRRLDELERRGKPMNGKG